ncbi:MAG: 5-(carboxyamino)imidazole ribonucleotide mutase [Chloroflexota bacterium]|nr:5-(carboxyamino)imidazole ribonucleotide mutase [Chloroflexota bacterium]MCY3639027.1 5-(carboxyamino)imidazole ribonucleotide mutase [Chloroflexota bacterium]MDE2688409.1 5-(carboxyamino)imidazole ribonucleotide mutase [Chloroflexota bacterium]MYC06278.1 5-(carboxyamino)imidazole ribonucleotide mutase [Chloroflexota bacterium]
MPLVGVIMGSSSDEAVVAETVSVLDQMGIENEVTVASAHRTPEKVMEYVTTARERGIEVLIAAAGGSAGLPGVTASWTTLPVIGIPLPSSDLNGVDALYAIAQMPPGIPVACVAVGSWGARNAAFLAAQILGIKHDDIRAAYDDYRQGLKNR